jgi:Flp pilus assembly protein TadG
MRYEVFGNRSGAAAVEFAIVAPVFILIVLTMCAFGIYLSSAHSIQQIAADAARSAVAGLDEAERSALVQRYVDTATLTYPFIDPQALRISVGDDAVGDQFTVTLVYDASGLPIWSLFTFTLPDTEISRFATIRMGGA